MRTRTPITNRARDGRRFGGLHVGAALTAAGLSVAIAGALSAGPAYARPDTVPVPTESVPVTDETVPVTELATTTTLRPTTTVAPATSAASTTSTTVAPAVLPAHVLPSSGGSSTSTVAIGGLLIAAGAGTIAATRARRPRAGS
jgi:LPXTG-motif cell wall-anchored protein